MAKRRNVNQSAAGDPVPGSGIEVLPPWKAAKSGSISFKIRTNEPNGLIMYSRSGAHTRQDLFAFEIFSGHLYLHADLGSGPVKVKSSKQRVDDGTWHDVAFRRVERDGRVTVDGSSVEFRMPGNLQRGQQLGSRAEPNCEGLNDLHRGFSRITGAAGPQEAFTLQEFVQTRPSEAAKRCFEAEIAKGSDFKGKFHGQINWPCNSSDRQEFRETCAMGDVE
ncbi:hypothetical protein K0M31_013992 [Melipona bicolor]|uniref:Laminin G domain-containing protein n=1 Tax=Melipona bicolor TaxID=60889 RepID=A0AA40G7M8_9HYME|nr:hypothetical protein K0M31_013992 [Melipona bicolor]